MNSNSYNLNHLIIGKTVYASASLSTTTRTTSTVAIAGGVVTGMVMGVSMSFMWSLVNTL